MKGLGQSFGGTGHHGPRGSPTFSLGRRGLLPRGPLGTSHGSAGRAAEGMLVSDSTELLRSVV